MPISYLYLPYGWQGLRIKKVKSGMVHASSTILDFKRPQELLRNRISPYLDDCNSEYPVIKFFIITRRF